MQFWLLDQITAFEPNKQLTAVKNVSLSEEYLADHFPEFPVLPGVFMLEAAKQAGVWLIRMSEGYKHSIITLQEARAVKYADFVTPGNMLTMKVEQTGEEDQSVKMKFEGCVDDRVSVSGRLILQRSNLADTDPKQASLDARMIEYQRSQEHLLTRNADLTATAS